MQALRKIQNSVHELAERVMEMLNVSSEPIGY